MHKLEKGNKVMVDASFPIRGFRGTSGTIFYTDRVKSQGGSEVNDYYIVLLEEDQTIRAVSIHRKHLVSLD